jgi:hypothetical protein
MPTYTNLAILQGWLEIGSTQTVTTGRTPAAVIKGWIITTDHAGLEDCFEEHHPVVISGRAAEAILDINRKLNDKFPHLNGINLVDLVGDLLDQSQLLISQGRPYVIAQGKLLAHEGRSFVDVKHISILGLPWGVLDTLYELESVMEHDVQALVAVLTPLEKSRMNLALDTAMRELIAMRLPREMVKTDRSELGPVKIRKTVRP